MKRLVGLVSALALSTGCSDVEGPTPDPALREAARRFVPQDARDVFEAPGLPWIQLSFEVMRAAGDFGIAPDELSKAEREGWLLCHPMTSKWTGSYDARDEHGRYITERSYMLHKAGALVVLVGRHELGSETGWEMARKEPIASLVQDVFIVAHQASEQDARKQAADLGLQCG